MQKNITIKEYYIDSIITRPYIIKNTLTHWQSELKKKRLKVLEWNKILILTQVSED
jgi:hypothetical protein